MASDGSATPPAAYRTIPQFSEADEVFGAEVTVKNPFSSSSTRSTSPVRARSPISASDLHDALIEDGHSDAAKGLLSPQDDEEGTLYTPFELMEAEKKSTVAGATLNFTNSIIGAGIIGLPYAFMQGGFFMSILLLFFLTVLVDWTVVLLVKAGKLAGRASYQDLVDQVFGPKGRFLIAMFQFIFAFGAMCAYTVIIGDTLPTVLKSLIQPEGDPFLLSRNLIILVTSIGIFLPLSLQKDMAALSKTSAVSMIAILLILFTIMIRASGLPQELLGDPTQRFTFIGQNPVKAISVMSFALVCHHNTFIIYSSLDIPTLDRFARVTHLSAGISLIACLVLAITGMVTFTDKTQGNVLNNFAQSDFLINISRLAFGLNMVTTYPMELYVARHVLDDYFFPVTVDGDVPSINPDKRHVNWTLGLLGLSTIIALFIADVSTILEVTGSISATALAYIIPPWCWLKLSTVDRWRCYACIAFGICVMFLALI